MVYTVDDDIICMAEIYEFRSNELIHPNMICLRFPIFSNIPIQYLADAVRKRLGHTKASVQKGIKDICSKFVFIVMFCHNISTLEEIGLGRPCCCF